MLGTLKNHRKLMIIAMKKLFSHNNNNNIYLHQKKDKIKVIHNTTLVISVKRRFIKQKEIWGGGVYWHFKMQTIFLIPIFSFLLPWHDKMGMFRISLALYCLSFFITA